MPAKIKKVTLVATLILSGLLKGANAMQPGKFDVEADEGVAYNTLKELFAIGLPLSMVSKTLKNESFSCVTKENRLICRRKLPARGMVSTIWILQFIGDSSGRLQSFVVKKGFTGP